VEKGGKVNEMGCHHKLEQYLDEYIAAAGIAEEQKKSTLPRGHWPAGQAVRPVHVARRCMIHGAEWGIETATVNHSFLAIGITDYLERGGDINSPSGWQVTRTSKRRNSTTGAATK
jgi:integrase/recombinase XerD